MKTLFHSLYIICLLLISISCKKEKEKVYSTYYMDQEFKDYVVFPVGSYWVYEEESSGEIDSMYLYKQEIIIDDSRKKANYNYQIIKQNLSSSFFQDTLFGAGGVDWVGKDLPCTYFERYISNYSIINIQFFSKGKVGDINMYTNTIGTLYEAFYNSYQLKLNSYNEVKVFGALVQEAPNLPKHIYYSRYIGVIRKELFNGQVWNLKRYHIAR